jgi:hypothetical protein
MSGDRYALACNYAASRSEARHGAKAYLARLDTGGGSMQVVVRSRAGRHVTIWVRTHQLTNWRPQTIPFESPLWQNDSIAWFADRAIAQALADRMASLLPPDPPHD